MNDYAEREFWMEVRRGLLLVVGAIDRRFRVGRFEPSEKSMDRQRPPPQPGRAGRL